MVRLHLDYAVRVWNPSLKKDVNALEEVQEKATKIPLSLRNMSYERKLAKLSLTRMYLIEIYKISE